MIFDATDVVETRTDGGRSTRGEFRLPPEEIERDGGGVGPAFPEETRDDGCAVFRRFRYQRWIRLAACSSRAESM